MVKKSKCESLRPRHSYRRGYPSVTIRIQTKSAKIKQVLPNILSLNERYILKKTEDLAHVIHNYKSDIVMVSETWLSDDITDEALHFPGIPGFNVVRNDRVNKIGGGVAVFIKDTIPFKLRHDFTTNVSINIHYIRSKMACQVNLQTSPGLRLPPTIARFWSN